MCLLQLFLLNPRSPLSLTSHTRNQICSNVYGGLCSRGEKKLPLVQKENHFDQFVYFLLSPDRNMTFTSLAERLSCVSVQRLTDAFMHVHTHTNTCTHTVGNVFLLPNSAPSWWYRAKRSVSIWLWEAVLAAGAPPCPQTGMCLHGWKSQTKEGAERDSRAK